MSSEAKQKQTAQAVAEPAEPAGLGLSRPALTRAVGERAQGADISVTVTLRVGRQSYDATKRGVGHETIEMRIAAEATMDALHQAIGDEHFRLVGIKRMHAFDADVILVALRESRDAGQRFIGAVPVRTTLVHAAAAAVLDATNRIVTRPAE